jgi:hypothetical protein
MIANCPPKVLPIADLVFVLKAANSKLKTQKNLKLES